MNGKSSMKAPLKTNLSEQAMQSMRAEIASGRWKVGDQLPNEATLCSTLSISRGTLREAVRALVAQGCLETRQGSGTYVLSANDPVLTLERLHRTSLRDRFEMRALLEVEAARLAALRCTPAMIVHLQNLLDARGDYTQNDAEGFIARDFAFHEAMVAACGNQAMTEIYSFFSNSIRESIAATLNGDLPEPDLQAHQNIIDCIASGDPDQAGAAIQHFGAPLLKELERLLAA